MSESNDGQKSYIPFAEAIKDSGASQPPSAPDVDLIAAGYADNVTSLVGRSTDQAAGSKPAESGQKITDAGGPLPKESDQ